MALSMRTVIFSLVVLAALLTIPVMIGVYVCRDAKRRGMNAALWTLIAVAAPALIGFIIYLLVRGIILTCNVRSVPSLSQSSIRSVPTAEQSCAPPAPTARSLWNWTGTCAPSARLPLTERSCTIPRLCASGTGP